MTEPIGFKCIKTKKTTFLRSAWCTITTTFSQSHQCGKKEHLCVKDVYRETAPRYPEDRCIIEEARETLCIQCGTGHEHLQVCTETSDVFYQAKKDVCVECALMGFIDYDHTR